MQISYINNANVNTNFQALNNKVKVSGKLKKYPDCTTNIMNKLTPHVEEFYKKFDGSIAMDSMQKGDYSYISLIFNYKEKDNKDASLTSRLLHKLLSQTKSYTWHGWSIGDMPAVSKALIACIELGYPTEELYSIMNKQDKMDVRKEAASVKKDLK